MRLLTVHLALIGSLALTACASVPPLNFSPPDVRHSSRQHDAALVSTVVTIARPEEARGPIEIQGAESEVAALWRSALDDALTRMAMFRDDAPLRVSLTVRLLKLDVPAAGLSMTTQTIARYEIIDRATGVLLFTSDVESEGVVPVDYAFMGFIRARESASRSIQNNIAGFLHQLAEADLAPPVPTVSPVTE